MGLDVKWRDVVDYEGIYEISNDGQVRSIDRYIRTKRGKPYFMAGKEKAIVIDRDGYCIFKANYLNKGKMLKVHREVMKAFSPVVNMHKLQINHKNGIKHDNRIFNLEWCDQSWNSWHSKNFNNKRRYNRSRIMSDEQIIEVANMYIEGSTVKEIAKSFNVKDSYIRSVIGGDTSRPVLQRSNLLIPIMKEKTKRSEEFYSYWPKINYERLREVFLEGLSSDIVARYEQKSKTTINAAFKLIREKYPEDIKLREKAQRNVRNAR